MAHALTGGTIGLVLATIGAAATWSHPEKFGAHWYPVALVLLAIPTAWAGGKIRGDAPPRGFWSGSWSPSQGSGIGAGGTGCAPQAEHQRDGDLQRPGIEVRAAGDVGGG